MRTPEEVHNNNENVKSVQFKFESEMVFGEHQEEEPSNGIGIEPKHAKWIEDAIVNPHVIEIIRGPRITKLPQNPDGGSPKKAHKPNKEASFAVDNDKREELEMKPLGGNELNLSYAQALLVLKRIMINNQVTLQLDEENVCQSFNLLADKTELMPGDTHKTIRLDAKGKFNQFLTLCLRKKVQLSLPIKTFLPLC